MIYRICKSGYFMIVCIMFGRDGVRMRYNSRWVTRVYLSGNLQDFFVLWRICKSWILHTCFQHVLPGWSLYQVWGRYFTLFLYLSGNLICVICTYFWFVGSLCSVHTCDLQDLYDLPDWVESVWSVWSTHLERDDVCMIGMICTCLSVVCMTCRNCMICRIRNTLAGVYLRGMLMCVICTPLLGAISMMR